MNLKKLQLANWNSQSEALSLPQRWTDRTRALRGKFERSCLRQPGLDLTLLQPRGPLSLHYHRWQGGDWTLSPNIQLAIRPLLEKTFWQGMTQGAALIDRKGNARTMLAKSGPERRDATWGVLVPQLLKSQTALKNGGDFQSTGGIVQAAVAPLARVFALSKREQDGADGSALNAESNSRVFRQNALALRVIRHYARVEEMARRILVSTRPPVASVAKNVERREAVIEAPPVSPIGVKGRMGMDTSNFDIERLTDRVVRQLDGRLIAHKERLGRLF